MANYLCISIGILIGMIINSYLASMLAWTTKNRTTFIITGWFVINVCIFFLLLAKVKFVIV
ncbi:MAG: hypothetical protein ACRCXX_13895 [Cetobacterium sp.]|uniref:hypothetical protein n=1 Tax=Cetobacterium sp. TaxID=2071632 RepID=UPI003F348363